MPLRPAALPAVLLLSACAGAAPSAATGPVAPRTVTLYRDTVTARMPDGTLCAAVREGESGPWTTTFRGCPYRWPVRVARPATVPRLPLAPAATDPWVTLEAPAGPLGYAPRP